MGLRIKLGSTAGYLTGLQNNPYFPGGAIPPGISEGLQPQPNSTRYAKNFSPTFHFSTLQSRDLWFHASNMNFILLHKRFTWTAPFTQSKHGASCNSQTCINIFNNANNSVLDRRVQNQPTLSMHPNNCTAGAQLVGLTQSCTGVCGGVWMLYLHGPMEGGASGSLEGAVL